MGKTIKQIADEIGVSKTAVRKKMTDEVKTKFAETIGNTVYISPKGESIIKSMFLASNENQTETKIANQNGNQTETVSTLVSVLQNELEIKNKQIESLQDENKKLISALENTTQSLKASQTLHAKDIQLKDMQLLSAPTEKKSGFFSWFRR